MNNYSDEDMENKLSGLNLFLFWASCVGVALAFWALVVVFLLQLKGFVEYLINMI